MQEANRDSLAPTPGQLLDAQQRYALLGTNGTGIAQSLLMGAQRLLRTLLTTGRTKPEAAASQGLERTQRKSRDVSVAGVEFDTLPSEDELGAVELGAEASGLDPVAEEVFAGRTALSVYLERVRKLKPLGAEEEADLAHCAQAGNTDALNKLVAHSLHAVPRIAREFANRGLPLEDLVEEGNLGLYRAVMKFDPELGFRFSTYARWWIRHEIRSAVLNTGRLVRLPVHVFKAMAKVQRDHRALRSERLNDGGIDERFTLNDAYNLTQYGC